ncbi:MAG: cephalosporin hydroxylase family protein [Desulfamplus sp.]|nr:cephalosporin hydroxylase family protein [Desulfamplus sp.]
MGPNTEFLEERRKSILNMGKDKEFRDMSLDWILKSNEHKYGYNFTWMGRPIIQFPNDMFLIQELIWQIKPDLIIETGIAHGGSIIFSASMLELVGGNGIVVGIDIDIRKHNRVEIEKHPMMKRIIMIEGSSTDEAIINQVYEIAKDKKSIMVILDSSHTHEHVLGEINAYGKLVSVGSYMVVFDTCIEFFPKGYCSDRPWDVGNNPMTAIQEYLKNNDLFIRDDLVNSKAVITAAPNGYLRKIKENKAIL